ncbi:MAG: cysteine--tRNA ligase [Hyphomicrobiales bacterium]
MELRLYDTLTRPDEALPFQPLDPKNVRMYVCGPTVYDFAHIGNARPVIVFDVLYRLLRHLYPGEGRVTYVRNITDVDDKINARAAERGISIGELTKATYENFKADVAALGCLPPTVEPRATEHIGEMKTLIEKLVASKHAYVAEEHVLFDVPSMKDYGKLSNRMLDEMVAGARVEVAPYKRDAMDFVLWKPSKEGEPSWPSPAGIKTPGRPGWHIECSAMAWKHLGETFDIHGGGIDLVFPHHENEIAQSRCAFHTGVMANYWMHNGFLQVEGEKMAKSTGNFVTINELRTSKKFGGRKWSGGVLKLAMLQAHYRKPIDWTVSLLEQAESRLERWRKFAAERTVRTSNHQLMDSFMSELANDLNTPAAFSIIDQAVNEETGSDEDRYTVYLILKFLGIKGQKTRVAITTAKLQDLIRSIGTFSRNDWDNFTNTVRIRPLFKSDNLKPETKLFVALQAISELTEKLVSNVQSSEFVDQFKNDLVKQGSPPKTDAETRVRRLIAEREAARKAKNFSVSDRIRNELVALNVEFEDKKDGTTTWKFKQ